MGETPLEVAARWGHVKMVEFLLTSYPFSKENLKKAKEKSLNYQIKNLFEGQLKRKINGNETNKTNKRFWGCNFLC